MGTVFISKLSADGSQLLYSTYLGGSTGSESTGIGVDSSGHAFVTGFTEDFDFPTTPGAYQTSCPYPNPPYGCLSAAFLSELNPTVSGTASLVYSTYFGESQAYAIAMDTAGHPYITGAGSVPTTPGAFEPRVTDCSVGNNPPCPAAFVAKFDTTQSGTASLLYSTGICETFPEGVAVDSAGNAHITGSTVGFNYYAASCLTANGFQTAVNGNSDAFLLKLDSSASSVLYATYLGGSNGSNGGYGTSVAVDSSGIAYVTGQTSSSDFPLMNPIDSFFGGTGQDTTSEAFVTKIDTTQSGAASLVYSTYLGDSPDGYGIIGQHIAVDASGNAYVIGYTNSPQFLTAGPFEPVLMSNEMAFVAKVSSKAAPGVAFSPGVLTFAAQDFKTTSPPQTVRLTAAGSHPLHIGKIAATGNFAQTNNCGATVPAAGSCTITVTFTPTAVGSRTGTIRVTDNASGSPQSMALTGTGNGIPRVSLKPGTLTFPTTALGATGAPKTVTLTNPGAGGLDISSMVASGDFAVSNSCSSVGAGGSCSFTVTFTPTATGTRTGTILITDNAPNSPQKVTLTGTGTSVEFSKATVIFAKRTVGTTSAPQSVTLTNVGPAVLNITSIGIAGADPADSAQTNTCGSSVNPGANCTISVTFTPTATGARTATISVADDGGGSPQTVHLYGTGR